MKPLFRNYNFEFAPQEKKILTTMVKQIINQITGDTKYVNELRIYESIKTKLTENDNTIKFTKEEVRRIETQLEENIKHLQTSLKKSWFFKRWLIKPLLSQYQSLLNNYFRNK